MLANLDALNHAPTIASDGEAGKIKNFFFDDQSWMIRYLVVDVGGWINRHAVVIPVSSADQPVWTEKSIHVLLSKRQVRHSPAVDTTKPVSRQQDIAMTNYYGLRPFWGSNELPYLHVAGGKEYPVGTMDDPHLRSAWDVMGYEVWATDSKIGYLEDFIMESSSWHMAYLDVKTGDWLHSRSLLLPTAWVKSISWADCRVNMKHTR